MAEMRMERKLVLANGAEFYGKGFGSANDALCELVFNTSMVGYQEIVTDPGYADQMVMMTYPLIFSTQKLSKFAKRIFHFFRRLFFKKLHQKISQKKKW